MIKISRTKLVSSLMTIASIGIIIVLFSTSVQGATTTFRPLDDWAGENVLDWADLDTLLAISPHGVEWTGVGFPLNFLFYTMQPISECESKGFIKERVIDKEHTIITLYMHVKEVPFMLFSMPDPAEYPSPEDVPPYYMFPPKYSGTMKYYFQCRMIFNTEALYAILNDYPEQNPYGKIPSLFEIFAAPFGFWLYPIDFLPIVDYVHFEGDGHITAAYPDPAGYPDSVSCDGKVLVNQVGIWDSDLGDFRWPHDSVLIK
ncbi:MAG: hypothetical protein ACFFA8_06620 [Promethearchaeota archaeon]